MQKHFSRGACLGRDFAAMCALNIIVHDICAAYNQIEAPDGAMGLEFAAFLMTEQLRKQEGMLQSVYYGLSMPCGRS